MDKVELRKIEQIGWLAAQRNGLDTSLFAKGWQRDLARSEVRAAVTVGLITLLSASVKASKVSSPGASESWLFF
jgi:hypothetical protein